MQTRHCSPWKVPLHNLSSFSHTEATCFLFMACHSRQFARQLSILHSSGAPIAGFLQSLSQFVSWLSLLLAPMFYDYCQSGAFQQRSAKGSERPFMCMCARACAQSPLFPLYGCNSEQGIFLLPRQNALMWCSHFFRCLSGVLAFRGIHWWIWNYCSANRVWPFLVRCYLSFSFTLPLLQFMCIYLVPTIFFVVYLCLYRLHLHKFFLKDF